MEPNDATPDWARPEYAFRPDRPLVTSFANTDGSVVLDAILELDCTLSWEAKSDYKHKSEASWREADGYIEPNRTAATYTLRQGKTVLFQHHFGRGDVAAGSEAEADEYNAKYEQLNALCRQHGIAYDHWSLAENKEVYDLCLAIALGDEPAPKPAAPPLGGGLRPAPAPELPQQQQSLSR